MSPDEARDRNVADLLARAEEALASARLEARAGHLRFAVNRAYYACFYAANAILLAEGRHFVKHAGVRSALHQFLINTGRLSRAHGQTFDTLFDGRHEADYGAATAFDSAEVQGCIERAQRFVEQMKRMHAPPGDSPAGRS
jgi:uncharacterized protein (UPF0332 family)